MKNLAIFGGSLIGIVVLIVIIIGGGDECGPAAGPAPSASSVTTGQVAGYNADQLKMAKVIMDSASKKKMTQQAQVIGVMTAIGESTLSNLDHGDEGPGITTCSLGLFQQQWCLAGQPWGTKEDVMNPAKASDMFFTALSKVPDWQRMEPSIAANSVQGNLDPQHYAKYYTPATQIVSALSGATVSGSTKACTPKPGVSGNPGKYKANGDPPGPWGGYQNGRIDTNELTTIPFALLQGMKLRADATQQATAMNNAFRAQFGRDLVVNDAYRDYDEQVATKLQYGSEAAQPGTSNHGWALAIDFGNESAARLPESHPWWAWLDANAGKYGWVNPAYMRTGGSGPYEPWHWEYYGNKG